MSRVNATDDSRFIYGVVMVLVFTMLVGCSSADIGNTAMSNTGNKSTKGTQASVQADRVLTYYIDQWGQDPHNIRALMEYEVSLKACRQAGLPITPLSKSDVAKLGVRRVRVWQRPGRRVEQVDTWTPYGSKGQSFAAIRDACHYLGVKQHSERQIWVPPDGLYVLNLTKGTGTYEVGHTGLARPRLSPDVDSHTLDKLEAIGFQRLSMSHALGQPCQIWKGSDAQGVTIDNKLTVGGTYVECDWTGGTEWGIGGAPTRLGEIVLWRKMDSDVPQAPGWLKTHEFDVSHLPDGSDKFFEIPENISIRSKTPGVAVPDGKP